MPGSASIVLVFLSLFLLVRRWCTSIKLNDMLAIKNKELQELEGILPLCSFCKKVRDDSGYWEQVDTYIRRHSGAKISHSVCPECMKKQYPEEYASIYPEKIENGRTNG